MNKIKFLVLAILIFMFIDSAISQTIFPQAKEYKNETDKKGNRKGDWLISYKNYDWSTSKTNIVIDLNHLEEIIVKNAEDTKNISFLENVTYNGGLKSGVGYFYVYNQNKKSAFPLAIVNYKNGKLDGPVLYYSNFNDQIPFAKVNYNGGVLIDQLIERTPVVITTNQAVKSYIKYNDGNNDYTSGHLAIRIYEKISSGKSTEFQNWIDNPNFQNSDYFALQLVNQKLNNWAYGTRSVFYKEIIDDEYNKTIICIPLSQDQPNGVVTQYSQKFKIDSSGKIINYGMVSIFQTKNPLNHLTSTGKFATGVDTKNLDSRRNLELIKKHLGEIPWTFFDGVNLENSCLIYRTKLNQFNGTPEGEVKTYYFNEDMTPIVSNTDKLIKTIETYSNESLNGPFKIYYPDKTLAVEMSFKEGKLDGRFTSFFNPTYNFIYVPYFPIINNQQFYNFDKEISFLNDNRPKRDPKSIYFVDIPYVRTSVDLFSELGTITNCKHSKPKSYKEIAYACDFKANKVASDIVYFYNEKSIIFRQGIDLNSFTDKDWTYYNTDGSVCLIQAQAIAMYKAKKEKEQAELQKQQAYNSSSNNNSLKSNARIIGDVKVEGNTALIYDENGNYTNNVVQLGFKGTLSGFNSSYIVVTDGDYVKIHDAHGNYINKGFNLCGGCYVKNVTNSAILVKDAYGTMYYDFLGNYTNKYVND